MMGMESLATRHGIAPAPAHAWEKGAVAMPGNPGQTCAMHETGQVGVSFNNVMVTKLDRIGAEMDEKIDEMIALAKQSGIAKIEVQSYSYNVYPVSSGYPAGASVPVPVQRQRELRGRAAARRPPS